MPSPTILFPRWSEIWFVRSEGRYRVVVSTDEFNQDSATKRVLLARGTFHSSSEYPPLLPGEVPLAYPDPKDARYFPEEFRFKLTLFQLHSIRPFPKSQFHDPAILRPLGASMPSMRDALRMDMRAVFLGYGGSLPRIRPRRRSPHTGRLRNGQVIEVVHPNGSTSAPSAVVSHDLVHDWYPEEVVVVVPMRDPSATGLFDKFDLDLLHSVNLRYDRFKSVNVIDTLPAGELDDLTAACSMILGF